MYAKCRTSTTRALRDVAIPVATDNRATSFSPVIVDTYPEQVHDIYIIIENR